MKSYRVDSGSPRSLEISWEADRVDRMDPGVLTSLACEQVPVLGFVNWSLARVEPGYAESVLPLNPESTNQHFTHQAALLLLAADYTGGTALASLVFGWPVVGIHPITSSQSMSLWLIKGDIKYLRPSVGDLTVTAAVAPERHDRIVRRFLDGRPVLETIEIGFLNRSVKVAEASLTYFARQSDQLRSDGADPSKVNVLYELKLTSSAELIAGVRALQNGGLFHDPYAARMAGQHGRALATRFCRKCPQLGGMVAARTRHLDETIARFLRDGGRDIAILGVGWDMRPFRLEYPAGTRIYELDFPTTLAEREERLLEMGLETPAGVERFPIPIDLRTKSLDEVLQGHTDPRRPLMICWEGMSMYFEEPDVRRVFEGMAPLFANPGTQLWVDLVDREAVEHPDRFPREVQQFLRSMQLLGEPFVFGTGAIDAFLAEMGLHCREVAPSDVFFPDERDPVYGLYRFCVATGASRPAGPHLRIDHPKASENSAHPLPGTVFQEDAGA